MFDDTFKDFMAARKSRGGKMDRDTEIKPRKIMIGAPSYDVLKQTPYSQKVNYFTPVDRNPDTNYDESDEVRRVIDVAYLYDKKFIDILFTGQNNDTESNNLLVRLLYNFTD